MIDVKKILGKSPKDVYEAIDALGKTQQDLLAALHIMESIIDNPLDRDIHERRIKKFLDKYSKLPQETFDRTFKTT